MVSRPGFQCCQQNHRGRLITAGLLCELPFAAGALKIALGCERQPQIVGGFMVAIYPRQRLREMLRRKIVLVENDFESACRLVQRDTIWKARQSLLVRLECHY